MSGRRNSMCKGPVTGEHGKYKAPNKASGVEGEGGGTWKDMRGPVNLPRWAAFLQGLLENGYL